MSSNVLDIKKTKELSSPAMAGREKFPFGPPPAIPVRRATNAPAAPRTTPVAAPPQTAPSRRAILPTQPRPEPVPEPKIVATRVFIEPERIEELLQMVPSDTPLISIIFGTYNRFELLKRAVESIRVAVGSLSYEIVVADGGSTDGSREWMDAQPDIVLAGEPTLEGAVKAFNQAWSASRGAFIANFNDDAVYIENALERAVAAFKEPNNENVGQMALECNQTGSWGVQYVNHCVYANFGVTRRDVVEKICEHQGGKENFWNPIYHTYAADCEHSCWVWKMGLRVLPLEGARVADKGAKDDLRRRNEQINKERGDSNLFWRRWGDPQSLRP